MNVENIKKYEAIKLQIKALESELKVLEPEVVSALESIEEDQIETDNGKFYFTKRKTWTYSPAVKELESKVKETKKTEEETGVATATESKSLTYRAK